MLLYVLAVIFYGTILNHLKSKWKEILKQENFNDSFTNNILICDEPLCIF